MTAAKMFRLLPALGFVCTFGITPAAAQTAPAGTMAPMSSTGPKPAPQAMSAKPAMTSTGKKGKLSKALQFSTASAAAAHCPNDTVEWSTMGKTMSYHGATSKHYGKTKHGAYACKADLDAAGFHQAKN